MSARDQAAYNKSYYAKNRERILRVNREDYAARRKAGMPCRKQDGPARMLKNTKSRALKEGIPFSITVDDISIPTHCPVLGIPLKRGIGKPADGSPSLDKIIPALGYIPGNVIVVSNKANRIKSDATFVEILAVGEFYRCLHRSKSTSARYNHSCHLL